MRIAEFSALDSQLARWAERLKADVRVPIDAVSHVASQIAADVRELEPTARARLRPIGQVSLQDRLDELVAFQAYMDSVSPGSPPQMVRAQVIVQNYVCFVYLGEALFRTLRAVTRPGSTARKCATFLTDNPIRAFRNAVAHGNWRYAPDFGGIEFWARKGSGADEPMASFEVRQDELSLWQCVARATAYATLLSVRDAG